MHCVTRARRTCWKGAQICARSRKCSVIPAFPRPNGTRTCPWTSSSRYTTGRIPWLKPRLTHRGTRPTPAAAMGQPANSSRFFDRVLKAFSGALLGSTLGLLLAATIDCAYAHAGQYGVRWLADVGLLAPVALLLGAGMAAARLFFHGGEPPRPGMALVAMNGAEPEVRA